MSSTVTLSAGSGKSYAATFPLIVPAAITKGGTILITAVAKDSGSLLSTPVQRTLVVHDGTAPVATAATSPGQTSLYRPGDSGTSTFSFSDNVGITSLNCTASGAATGSQNLVIDPPQKAISRDLAFNVAADAASGATVTLACIAADAAGNQTTKSIGLSVADIVAPAVAITAPAEGSSVSTGSTLNVSVQATDDLLAKEITLAVSGEINTNATRSAGTGKTYATSRNRIWRTWPVQPRSPGCGHRTAGRRQHFRR